MDLPVFLTHATAGAAFLGYVIALALRLTVTQPRLNVGRVWWTAGCLLLFVHVACAFQFVHHWSHRAAYAATARQTMAVTGFDSGGGLYVNYAVLAVWLLDICWWWAAPARHVSRSRRADWLLQGFLAFIWFNATVVFGHGMTRWLGAAAWLLLFLLWLRHRRRQSPLSSPWS